VGHRRRQSDVPHPLAPDLGLDHLHTTFLADDAAVFHSFVLAAVAFVVLHRAKNLGTKESIFFRLKRPVVDCLRLLDLSVGPGLDFFWRGNRDPNGVEA